MLPATKSAFAKFFNDLTPSPSMLIVQALLFENGAINAISI